MNVKINPKTYLFNSLFLSFTQLLVLQTIVMCTTLFPLQEFDSTYGPTWHCVVGTSFGSYVTHSLGGFLYFSIDNVYILLFKTGAEPLDH